MTTGHCSPAAPTADTGPRDYVLDVIGRTWGPRLVLGPETPVTIVDDLADIDAGTRVFRVDGFEVQHLGILRRRTAN